MKKLLLLVTFFWTIGMVSAQADFTNASDSDPEATKILNDLQSKYNGFDGLSVDFTLDIEIPQEVVESQNGKIIQKDNKFVLEMPQQTIYCNGEILWLYLKEMNEVQLNDVEDEEGESAFLSPSDILNMYNSGEFAYAVVHKGQEDNDWITQIEFKPLDLESEYSKLRLTLKDKATSLKRLKVFSKDGSRYTMNINKIDGDTALGDEVFEFDVDAYPDIIVEDLRL